MISVEISDNIIRVVILKIDGVYTQIHNELYCNETELEDIEKTYCDKSKWRIVTI